MSLHSRSFLVIGLLALVILLAVTVYPVAAALRQQYLPGQDTLWEQFYTTQAPKARFIHGMAYDSLRDRMILFGGDGSGSERLADTWEYDGVNWMQVQPAQSPPGRVNIQGGMVFDTNRSKVVLFGGLTVPGYVNDTWEYNGTTWLQLSPAASPSIRDAHAMVYDPYRHVIVLFGGYNPTNHYLNDTWEFNGTTWTQINTPQSPPGRHHHAMAYDSQRQLVVLFGGHGSSDPQMEDTWEYNGTTWQQAAPATSPAGRESHSMAYDSQRDVVVLFGGTTNGSDPVKDTWEYDGTTWTPASTIITPTARLGFPMVYDSTRNHTVLFGGAQRIIPLNVTNDTWGYNEDPLPRDWIVSEAQANIGMPYDIERGCPSPYLGCGYPYHGFNAGVCTDSILDAYLHGATEDIQASLALDHASNPGRYQYGTARYSEDLRRFFNANEELLLPADPFLKGDIAFFDWDGNSISDHAAVITQVDATGRPLSLVDAKGFTANNLTGTVTEEAWSSYYEQYSLGHGRISIGAPGAPITTTQTLNTLRVQLEPASASMRLVDNNGKTVSSEYDENLVASNVAAYIPYIPGGSYDEASTKTTITVTQPYANSPDYFVDLTSAVTNAYTLTIETLQDGIPTDVETISSSINPGDTHQVTVKLKNTPGFVIDSATLAASPRLLFPGTLDLYGTKGTSIQTSFTISETSGLLLDRAEISASILKNQMGGSVAASKLSLTPNRFSITGGQSQQVVLVVDLVGVNPGMYQGRLYITSRNDNPVMIPLTVFVDLYRRYYLPLTVRN